MADRIAYRAPRAGGLTRAIARALGTRSRRQHLLDDPRRGMRARYRAARRGDLRLDPRCSNLDWQDPDSIMVDLIRECVGTGNTEADHCRRPRISRPGRVEEAPDREADARRT